MDLPTLVGKQWERGLSVRADDSMRGGCRHLAKAIFAGWECDFTLLSELFPKRLKNALSWGRGLEC